MILWCFFITFSSYCACFAQSQHCRTPNGEEATCKSLFDCTIMHEIFTHNDPATRMFLHESKCSGGCYVVCCGTSANYTVDPSQPKQVKELSVEEKRDYVKTKIMPSKTHCGKQHTDEYFYNDTLTSVDEFPWMVYLSANSRYLNPNNKFEENIGIGALISNQFVLTSKKDYGAATVIIGQHHILKDTSCIATLYGDDCTNPALRISIDKMFSTETSNIALLKLNTVILYTDYVRPICLPHEEFRLPTAGETLYTSGWGGEQFIDGRHQRVKKRLKHLMIAQEMCSRGNPMPHPICGITFLNSSSFVCSEDNGGPIMYKARRNWVAEGVVVGFTSCAKRQPVTGERITQETINWIFDKIYENN